MGIIKYFRKKYWEAAIFRGGRRIPFSCDGLAAVPDRAYGIIRLYDYLNDLETVASALAESHILVTGLSVSGDTLEDYFLSKIGGTKDVKSPKN